MAETKKLTGIAASDGVGIAKSYLLVDPSLAFPYNEKIKDVAAEESRLDKALSASKYDLKKIEAKAEKILVKKKQKFFRHILRFFPIRNWFPELKHRLSTNKLMPNQHLKM